MRTLPILALPLVLAAPAFAQPVLTTLYENSPDNGIFTPFNAGNAANLTYGDSGWIGFGGTPPYILETLSLQMATFNGSMDGTADITVTFNDGDPSGLIFGPGTELFRTTFTAYDLPGSPGENRTFFLTVPLGGIRTAGNYNNIGFSIALSYVQFDGNIGFFCSTAHGTLNGFYTNNASYRDTSIGPNWGLFAFGPDPDTQIASFTARLEGYATPPCPADLGTSGGEYGQDSALDNNDFISFITLFFAQSPLADVGAAGGLPSQDQAFDNNDFIAFINLFFDGCPG